MSTTAKPRSRRRRSIRGAISIVVEGLGILTQLLLVYLGMNYLLVDDGEVAENVLLSLWGLIATIYLAFTVFWLNLDLKLHDQDHVVTSRLAGSPLVRWFSTVVTFTSSVVGLAAATSLILTSDESEFLSLYELIAVWAMLASWAMFHWGYARIYHSQYSHRPDDRPLRFPGTEQPRLIDFVYFAFTNGTSFAPSDVSVATSRMRWTVVWHTTFSFFFNALIIVLTMNTISGGFASI